MLAKVLIYKSNEDLSEHLDDLEGLVEENKKNNICFVEGSSKAALIYFDSDDAKVKQKEYNLNGTIGGYKDVGLNSFLIIPDKEIECYHIGTEPKAVPCESITEPRQKEWLLEISGKGSEIKYHLPNQKLAGLKLMKLFKDVESTAPEKALITPLLSDDLDNQIKEAEKTPIITYRGSEVINMFLGKNTEVERKNQFELRIYFATVGDKDNVLLAPDLLK